LCAFAINDDEADTRIAVPKFLDSPLLRGSGSVCQIGPFGATVCQIGRFGATGFSRYIIKTFLLHATTILSSRSICS